MYLSFSSPYFLDWQNLLNVTFAVSAIGIAAAFATLVVIGGGLDLTPVTVGIMAGLTCVKGVEAGGRWCSWWCSRSGPRRASGCSTGC